MHRCGPSRGALILLLPADHRRRLGAGDSAAERHVRDESGAVLPGVTVTVTQTDTAWFAPP